MNDEASRSTAETPTRPVIRIDALQGGKRPVTEPRDTESAPAQQTAPEEATARDQEWGAPARPESSALPTPSPRPASGGAAFLPGPASAPARPRLSRAARLALLAAFVLAGLALASNLVVIAALLRVQGTVGAGLDRTIGQLEGLCGNGAVPIVFPISQTIRFKGDVSLPENLTFPFKGNIPIRTTVRMVITFLPGAPTVEIPINTVVPVDTQVALPGGIRIPIDTEVPIRQDFTVDLCTQGNSFKSILVQTLQELQAVRKSMRFP